MMKPRSRNPAYTSQIRFNSARRRTSDSTHGGRLSSSAPVDPVVNLPDLMCSPDVQFTSRRLPVPLAPRSEPDSGAAAPGVGVRAQLVVQLGDAVTARIGRPLVGSCVA